MRIFSRAILLGCLLAASVSGICGAESYRQGDQGQDVAAIQSQLGALGYEAGAADGDFGNATADAVRAFQRDRGLEVDGIIGAQTYRMLMGRDIPASRSDGSTSAVRRVIQTAMRYQGVPYSFGGTGPGGFDCSGYVRYVYAQAGVYLPRAADEQFEVGQSVSYGRLQPGDLVFFQTYAPGASHVGIYVGGGQFIHASTSSGVIVSSLDSGYWGARYIGARKVL